MLRGLWRKAKNETVSAMPEMQHTASEEAPAAPDTTAAAARPPLGEDAIERLREDVVLALKTVYDPEIPVNIYELGLVYRVDVAPTGDVHIDMTLTAPGCPVAATMPLMVKEAVEPVEGIGAVDVEIVWEPPWDQSRMSDEAKLELGWL
jgi:FeS assembly SUF system protein